MKIKIDLLPGEEMLFELEADFWARGNNPLTKIIGNFFRIFAKIFGTRVRGFLTVTNKRIIETREDIICYCITSGRHTKVVTKESVKEVGYEMTKMCGLCCDSYTFYYEGATQATSVDIQDGSDEKMQGLIKKFLEK